MIQKKNYDDGCLSLRDLSRLYVGRGFKGPKAKFRKHFKTAFKHYIIKKERLNEKGYIRENFILRC